MTELDLTNISSVPDEIIEHNIFNNFLFNKWIKTFTLVCKRWKRLCDRSTIEPKQLTLHLTDKFSDVGIIIGLVKRYQPTILYLYITELYRDKFIICRMCEASKRLHTLVIKGYDLKHEIYIKPLPRITTVAITQATANRIQMENLKLLFPNLKRLHLTTDNRLASKLDDLDKLELEEIVYEGNYEDPQFLCSEKPKITLIKHHQRQVLIKQHQSTEFVPITLSYEKYFQYFGETKFYSSLRMQNNEEAADLIANTTTMKYEEFLHDSILEYKFPTSLKMGQFVGTSNYWQTMQSNQTAFDAFGMTDIIPMPVNAKLQALAEFGRIDTVLLALEEMFVLSKNLHSVKNLFFSKILPLISKETIHQRDILLKIVEKLVHLDIEALESLEDFAKISDLRADWSTQKALTTNAGLCYEMCLKGCIADAESCVILFLSQRENVRSLTDLFVQNSKYHPVLVDVVNIILPKKGSTSLIHFRIPFEIEKNGKSLFNISIKQGQLIPSELVNFKHLVNHMDSKGRTPLEMAIKTKNKQIYPLVAKLLELGADPTIHLGNKLSPLCTVLHRSFSNDLTDVIDTINVLVEYGADLNAPCMHERRMCSPLMVAFLKTVDEEVIRLMVVLGARLDYADETGRTVLHFSMYGRSFEQELMRLQAI